MEHLIERSEVPSFARGKRALYVAQAIVLDIETESRQVGDRLPPEHHMMARYEVARATLREALRFLELQGVLHLQPGRGGGPVIARPQTSDFTSSLALVLHFVGTDLRALIELREALAPHAAAHAAQRATAADLVALGSCFSDLEHQVGSPRFEETNRRFHDLLAWASGNPLFGLLTSALHLLTRDLSRQLGYSEHERENQVRRLARVVHAVRLRDTATSRREMERLVEGSAEYLGRRSPDLMSQKVRWTQAFEA
jgi:GntR family transcriptional repressor for pyruvate dehydrogenase complex